MCDIPLDISRDELDRRIDVFGAGHFGLYPTIVLHGRLFRYAGSSDTAQKKDGSIALPSGSLPVVQFQK
jgi:hypothetical protein